MRSVVYLWGDSIGRGVIYNPERRRYQLAKRRCIRLLQEQGYQIENHAAMGATILDGFQDLCATETEPGAVAVVEYAGNDCDLDWNSVAASPDKFHDGRVSLAEFRAMLDAFIGELRRRSLQPVLVTPPPLVSARYQAWVSAGRDSRAISEYLGDPEHIYRWQERYSRAIEDAGRANGCAVLDIRSAFLEARDFPSLMCQDGIHPTEEGQMLMARAVLSGISAMSEPLPAAAL